MIFDKIHSYSFPTNIRFGKDAVLELPAYLKANKLNSPLLVSDPQVKELAFFKKIEDDLKRANLKVNVFSNIHKNPVKSDVLNGGDTFLQCSSDSIVGIGGGAAMDVARAIVLRVNHKRDLFDYDDLIGGDKYVTEDVPHFITIPTTAGTGSEVGRSAIISEDDSKKKRILFHAKLMAQQVFADPMLTMELPPAITAATGMDALTHNMEAFLAKNYHPMADGIAAEGIRLIFNSIEKAVNNPDLDSRSKMMIGSLMGAVAFQKGLGIVHSLAHPLSTLLDMHHGLANAIMLPYGMRFNYRGFESRFELMALTMGLQKTDGINISEVLFKLNERIGMPIKLSEKGVNESNLEELADLALADFCHPNNPKPVQLEDFQRIYKEAL